MATLLVDRLSLSPRRLGDGGTAYVAWVAYADRRMRYVWGESYPTEEALASDEALEAWKGLALVEQEHHRPGEPIDLERDDVRVLGTIIDAGYDRERRAQWVRVKVTDPGLLADLRAGKPIEVSAAYKAELGDPDADGAFPQLRREPNHLAVVDMGRMPGAAFVTDSPTEGGSTMTQEQIEAAIRKALAEHLATEREQKQLADKADQALAAEKARADQAEAQLAAVLESVGADKPDAVPDAVNRLLVDSVAADVQRLEVARKLGIELPDTSTPATRLADLLKAAELPEVLADSAEHADALLTALADKAEQAPAPRARDFAPTSTAGNRRLTF
jgi:acyl carrier protein